MSLAIVDRYQQGYGAIDKAHIRVAIVIGRELISDAIAIGGVNKDRQLSTQIDGPRCITKLQSVDPQEQGYVYTHICDCQSMNGPDREIKHI